jgi:hypothetical protein
MFAKRLSGRPRLLVFQGLLQYPDYLAGGVHAAATATADLLEDVLLFEGTDQPTGGLEGDAQDLGQLADGSRGLRGRAEAMDLGADMRMVAQGSAPD